MIKIKNNQNGMIGHVEIVLVVAVISALGFVGWRVVSANDTSTQQQASLSQDESVDAVEELQVNLDGLKTIEEVQAIVASEVTDKTITGIELEVEDGITVYVVHFNDGSSLAFDATTGEKVDYSDDEDGEMDDSVSLPANFVAGISMQRAIDIALAERPNSKLEKVELELEDGVVVYSVRFTDDSRVDVSAVDGEVQRLKNEDGDDMIKRDSDDTDDDSDHSESDSDDHDDEDDEDDDDERDDDESDNSGSGSRN